MKRTVPPPPHVHFLMISQAARLAGLERGTIKRLVENGRLRAVIIPGDAGRWRRVSRADVLALRREMEEQLARSASCSTGSEKHHSRKRICRPAAAR